MGFDRSLCSLYNHYYARATIRQSKPSQRCFMTFAEYIYIDKRRLNSYFEQISPPVKYDKVSAWSIEVGLTGPKGQGTQARMGRPFTEHEKITLLFGDLTRHSTEHLPNVMDAVRRSWPGDWAGFAFESLKTRRVVLPRSLSE
jgi:hypothetical protein